MDTLPLKHRRVLLGILTCVFLLGGPVLLLYASGYRLGDDFALVRTGGIYVQTPESGAAVHLDNRRVGTSSLFRRAFFVQDLQPETYSVRVRKPAHIPWQKRVQVYPQRVSSVEPFLVRREPSQTVLATTTEPLARIPAGETVLPSDLIASTSAAISRAQAEQIIQTLIPRLQRNGVAAAPATATTTLRQGAASSTAADRMTVHAAGGIALWQDVVGDLRARWIGDRDAIPQTFCTDLTCQREMTVRAGQATIGLQHFTFHPSRNTLVVLEYPNAVFLTELDPRPPRNTVSIYTAEGNHVRVIGEDIIVIDGRRIIRLGL